MHPVNLGQSYEGLGVISTAPTPAPSEHFPYVHLEFKEDELELADEGTITFRYRVSREAEDKKTGQCSYDLDLLSVVGNTGKKEMKDDHEYAAENLDKLRATLEQE
jgi:hypothetical protein